MRWKDHELGVTGQLILGVIAAAVIVVGSAVVPAVVANRLDVWSQATVVMLSIALIAEIVGGYFAFHGTLIDQYGPLDPVRAFPIKWWMRPWFGFTWLRDGQHSRWQLLGPSPPWLLVRGLVRIAIAGFFILKIALTGAPY